MRNAPLHSAALMVKDLQVNMRVTTVIHMFGMPISIAHDIARRTITITKINAGEGTITGFNGLTPHTLVTMTFEECGIPDGPNGWSADVCTMTWEDASDLLRSSNSAARSESRQLISDSLQPLTPSWAS